MNNEEKFKNFVLLPNGNMRTPLFRAAFARLFVSKPFGGNPDGVPLYSVSMIFPAGTNFKPLADYIRKIATEKWGNKAQGILDKQEASNKRIFKDGSEMAERYAGFIDGVPYINASNKEKPDVVGTKKGLDGKLISLTEEGDVKSGYYCLASIKPYAYDNNYGRGMNLSLQNVQLIAEGEVLGGSRSRASDDFEAFDDDMGDMEGAPAAAGGSKGFDPYA